MENSGITFSLPAELKLGELVNSYSKQMLFASEFEPRMYLDPTNENSDFIVPLFTTSVDTVRDPQTGLTVAEITAAILAALAQKAANTPATETQPSLMSPEQYTKLLGIAVNANNYLHPSEHPASMITESATRRFVTDEQIARWTEGAAGGGEVGRLVESIAAIAFQLGVKGLIDASDIACVFVDVIDSEDAVELIEGRYENGKIFI